MTHRPEQSVLQSEVAAEAQNKRVSSSPTAPTLSTRTSSPETPTPAMEQTLYPRSYSPRKARDSHKAPQDSDSLPVGLSIRSVSSDDVLNGAIARLSLEESRSGTNEGSPRPRDNLARAPVDDSDTLPSQSGKGFAEDETFVGDDVDDLSETQAGLSGGQPTDMIDPEPRGEPQACLFVASLCSTRTEAELVDSVTKHFSKWGPLIHVKVLKDWAGRPYSFVQFEHVPHAQRAMAEAQNSVVDGRHIRIEQARVNRTLFILRISRSTTEEEISDVLKEYGRLEDVSIFYDPGPPRSRRYAFARFAYREDAIRAYMCLRGTSKWVIEWAPNLPNSHHLDHVDKESIFVGQLDPDTVTEETLYERFSKYGEIMNLNLVKRKKPAVTQFSAFAFIEYDNEQSSTNAIANENCSPFLGSIIRVQYREIPELRVQHQQSAHMAARSLAIAPNTAEGYFDGTGLFMPYRSQGPGRLVGYHHSYTPYSGPNVAMPRYVHHTPTISPYCSSAPQRSPGSEMPQVYYSGSTSFGTPSTNRDPRSARRDAGMKHETRVKHDSSPPQTSNNSTSLKSIASSFEYPGQGYIHTPEGIFYPHAGFSGPGPHGYEQGRPSSPVNPVDLPWRRERPDPRRRGHDSGREGFTGCKGSDSDFGLGGDSSGLHSNTRGPASSRNDRRSSSDANWGSR
ncbi:hypothetical protein MVEG_01042 [Podila verticillata NRRL 6337]|nr:hypothetical protein MVEG_01042 [Podila verticillata NRRL 6337]